MKTISITRLCKDVEYTNNKKIFEARLKFKKIPEKYIELLWKFYRLIKFTDFTSDRIKDLFSRGTSYQQVADKYGITLGAVKTDVFLFTKSLSEIFPIDFIAIIRDGKDLDEEYYTYVDVILDEIYSNVHVNYYDIKDSFSVDIFSISNTNQDFSDISTEDYLSLRDKLVMFSKPSQEFVLKNMDNKLLSYGVYLLTTKEEFLSEVDKERKKDLMKFTKID